MSSAPWFCWAENKRDGSLKICLDGNKVEGRLWMRLFCRELKKLDGSISLLPRQERKARIAMAIERFGRRVDELVPGLA